LRRTGKKPSYPKLKYYTTILMKCQNKTMKSVRKALSRSRFEPATFKIHSSTVIVQQDSVTIIVTHVT
jgi:hypothetical protein